MSFPLPDFRDGVDNDSAAALADFPVERPFFLFQDHAFTSATPRSLVYDPIHPVYSTSSCQVFIARTVADPPAYYALKCSSFVSRIRREFEMYRAVGPHPTVVRCYDTWMHRGRSFLQLELAARGSIRRDLFAFSDDDIWALFAHVLSALARLHAKGIMHLDISPANILQTVGGVFKLVDFGTAIPVGDFREDCEGAGPYVSPEALAFPHSQFAVGTPTDVFSFGVVMLELVTRKFAPRGAPGYEAIRGGTFDLSGVPQPFAFVPRMLDPDPRKRPTADELMRLPRVEKELDAVGNGEAASARPPPNVTKTPVIPSVRIPPETPYAPRYAKKARIIVFDDDLF